MALDAASGKEVWRKTSGNPRPAVYVNGAGVTPNGATCLVYRRGWDERGARTHGRVRLYTFGKR